jgi:hypothetical protein
MIGNVKYLCGKTRCFLDYPYLDHAGTSLSPDITTQWRGVFITGLQHIFSVSKCGYIGRGELSIKKGDLIFVFYGGKEPFIV